MRGKAEAFTKEFDRVRITPAYAGKSLYDIFFDITISGSPPPMRGKGKGAIAGIGTAGITPAYAGKSQ